MRVLVSLLALAAVVTFVEKDAQACPNVTRESKWRNSDIVVKGEANCRFSVNSCSLRISQAIKGSRLLKRQRAISVKVRFNDADNFYCGVEWALDEEGRYRGTFYLDVDSTGVFSASHYPDVKKKD